MAWARKIKSGLNCNARNSFITAIIASIINETSKTNPRLKITPNERILDRINDKTLIFKFERGFTRQKKLIELCMELKRVVAETRKKTRPINVPVLLFSEML